MLVPKQSKSQNEVDIDVSALTGFVPISDRALMIRTSTKYRTIYFIKVYAPPRDKSEMEKFYSDNEKAVDSTSNRDIILIMGVLTLD